MFPEFLWSLKFLLFLKFLWFLGFLGCLWFVGFLWFLGLLDYYPDYHGSYDSPSFFKCLFEDTIFPTTVPRLSLSSGTYVALENEGSVEVCVVLNVPLNIPLDLAITTTATSSTDGNLQGLTAQR